MPIILNEMDHPIVPIVPAIPVIKDLPPPEEMAASTSSTPAAEQTPFNPFSGLPNTGLNKEVLDQFRHIFGAI